MKKGFPVILICILLLSCFFTVSAQRLDPSQFAQRSSSESEQADEESTVPETDLPQMQPGDVVVFGRYEQDIDRKNGKEPIEWLVLTVEGDRALMLSLYGLDAKPYHTQEEETTWETSWIRQWMNETFYSSAFDEAEKSCISPVANVTRSDEKDPSILQNETADKIFLLSIDELDAFLPPAGSRQCKVTKNAVRSGAEPDPDKGTASWWLRDGNGTYAAIVRSDGTFGKIAGAVDSRGILVRPAFWLDLSEPDQLAGLIGTPEPTPAPLPPSVILLDKAKELGMEIPEPVGAQVLYLGEAETKDAQHLLAVFTKRPERSTMENLAVFVYKASFVSGNVKVSGLTAAIKAKGPVSIKDGKAGSSAFNFTDFEFTDDGAKGILSYTLTLPAQMGGGSFTFRNLEMNFVKITEP